jgi:hypothetical protein
MTSAFIHLFRVLPRPRRGTVRREQLAQIESHIAQCEAHIARHHEIIRNAHQKGRDASWAKDMLKALEASVRAFQNHRHLILDQLKSTKERWRQKPDQVLGPEGRRHLLDNGATPEKAKFRETCSLSYHGLQRDLHCQGWAVNLLCSVFQIADRQLELLERRTVRVKIVHIAGAVSLASFCKYAEERHSAAPHNSLACSITSIDKRISNSPVPSRLALKDPGQESYAVRSRGAALTTNDWEMTAGRTPRNTGYAVRVSLLKAGQDQRDTRRSHMSERIYATEITSEGNTNVRARYRTDAQCKD